MLAHDNEPAVKPVSFDTALSADEELDAVREQVSLNRDEPGTRIEPMLNLGDIDSLLNNAFVAASDADTQPEDGVSGAMTEDELLDAALFDDELAPNGSEPEDAATTSEVSTEVPHASLMEELGETFDHSQKTSPGDVEGASEHLASGLKFNEGVNASFYEAQRQQAADTMEHIALANAPGSSGDQQAQRHEVGIIQGMSMLGGAGLVGLSNLLRAGGNQINNTINSHKYGKLAGEIDSITQNMDGILRKFDANGFASGLRGLKGEHKVEFAKEFMASPANKQMLDDLVQSVGTLSTKANQAAVAGAAAGLSGDQIDIEISRKIKNVSDQHKEMLDSLHDHNGAKLSDRLSEMVSTITDFLKSLATKVAEAFGYNQRSERPGM